MSFPWSKEELKELETLLLIEGLPVSAIASRLGRTKGQVSGAIWRHIRGKKSSAHSTSTGNTRWTESLLTEPYALRKKRRARKPS